VGLAFDEFKLLHPDLPQRLDRRNVLEPVQVRGRVNVIKPAIAICTYRFDEGRALGWLFWQPILFNTMLMAFIPLVRGKGA